MSDLTWCFLHLIFMLEPESKSDAGTGGAGSASSSGSGGSGSGSSGSGRAGMDLSEDEPAGSAGSVAAAVARNRQSTTRFRPQCTGSRLLIAGEADRGQLLVAQALLQVRGVFLCCRRL